MLPLWKLPTTIRNFAWRLGRHLYQGARGEVPNEPTRNGEYWLLDRCFTLGIGRCLIDIGANVGDWSARTLQLGYQAKGVTTHAIEPINETRAILQQRLG